VVFDVPSDAQHPRLDVRDGEPLSVLIEFLLMGDEDSFLHARTTFALDDVRQAVTRPGTAPGLPPPGPT
jgi:hypothetical protein